MKTPSGNCIPSCSMTDASGLMKFVIMNFTLSIHSFCANYTTGLKPNEEFGELFFHICMLIEFCLERSLKANRIKIFELEFGLSWY